MKNNPKKNYRLNTGTYKAIMNRLPIVREALENRIEHVEVMADAQYLKKSVANKLLRRCRSLLSAVKKLETMQRCEL